MNKKAQGLSINTIIIAAIALLVLVVLSVVFTGRMGFWTKETSNCEPGVGRCAEVGVSCGEPGSGVESYPTTYTAANCPEGETCCIIGA